MSFNLPTEDFVRRPHPFNGTTVGKQAHEANHGEACRKSHAGLSTCRQLWGFNLNSHEQDNSKKSRYKSSLNNMTLGRFSFFATLFSELENSRLNRWTMDRILGSCDDHSRNSRSCMAQMWVCGRCFCSNPLVRTFDVLGRLIVSRLPA